MDELFNDINLDEKLEVETATAESGLSSTAVQSGTQGQSNERNQMSDEQKAALIEIPDTNSSLNTETIESTNTQAKSTQKKETTESTTLENEIKDFKDETAVETQTKEKGAPESTTQDNSSSSSPFVAFAKVLADEGVLSSFDPKKIEESGVEALIESVDEEIKGGIEAYKESLPAAVKEILDNYEEGVPLDKMIAVKSRQIEVNNISDKTLEDSEDLQKTVFKQDLLMRGYDDKDADEMVNDAIDLGKLEIKAKGSLGRLKVAYKEAEEKMKEDVKEYQKQLEEQRTTQLTQIKGEIEKTTEIIPSVPISKAVKDKIYQSLTTVVATDENNRPLNAVQALRQKNPVEFEKRLHYFALLGFFNEKPDFSKLVTTSKTAATKELEKTLERPEFKGGGGAANFKENTKEDLLSSLKQFNSNK